MNPNEDYEYRNSNYISKTAFKKPPRKLFSGSIVAKSITINNNANESITNRIANISTANSKKSNFKESNNTSN